MNNDQLQKLERLAQLKANGLLTDEEFTRQKQSILEQNSTSQETPQKTAIDSPTTKKKLPRTLMILGSLLLITTIGIAAFIWYNSNSYSGSPKLKQEDNADNSSVKPKSIQELKKEAEKKFAAYKPTIARTQDARVNDGGAIIGDFNNDGREDIIIGFVLSPKDGGNVTWGHSLVFYQNMGNSVKVVGGFEASYMFGDVKIESGKIYITKFQYAEDDAHCCPSIKTPIELTFSNGQVTERILPH